MVVEMKRNVLMFVMMYWTYGAIVNATGENNANVPTHDLRGKNARIGAKTAPFDSIQR